MSTESALSYAALILSDAELEITPENLLKLTSGAKIEIDNIWAGIYAKALAGQDISKLLVNFSAAPASGAAAPAAAGAAGAEAAAEEEKESEAEEEEDDDMGFGLFD